MEQQDDSQDIGWQVSLLSGEKSYNFLLF